MRVAWWLSSCGRLYKHESDIAVVIEKGRHRLHEGLMDAVSMIAAWRMSAFGDAVVPTSDMDTNTYVYLFPCRRQSSVRIVPL